ncbi:hypothetical protein EV193_104401 [Herbihabitans rhizosphaerae]|uniref:Uncharacterized protein n=1 Tax=Herbihabitans rhizosphaerae TaxID=1872711 RepID=A0A4Q7KRK0_9PSEU|nr:hypothetical protein [Herbihabitans rhizosphaerae]RZS39185.1 hypothetical protein EV193_104401 [Herbihabitans rhizosphaerae]
MATDEIEGFVVVGYEHDRMHVDWDVEVHATREAGDKSLAECRQAGWDWSLYALVPVDLSARERKRTADERRIEAVRQLLHGGRKTVRADDLRRALAGEA